nr:MAG: replication associated protein [Cressdnaviricota sp.]
MTCRGFCFTINNPTEWDLGEIKKLAELPNCLYLIYGNEKGECGTPHYQGFVRFRSSVTFSRIRSSLTRAHVERQKGTSEQASDYCKKEEDFVEFGKLPEPTNADSKSRWRNVLRLAKEGKMDELEETEPYIFLMNKNKLLSHRVLPNVSILPVLEHEWWYGESRTGKSKKLWEDYPIHYAKSLNKWWDGYDSQEVVAIEEMNPDSGKFLANFLKIWADRYPFAPEIKGGKLHLIRPKKIIVLSNYTIEECFERRLDYDPIKYRFKCIHFVKV